MTCISKYVFKTGSPFVRLYLAETVDSETNERQPLNLSSVTIKSSGTINGKPFVDFIVEKLDQVTETGYFLLKSNGNTLSWPSGTLKYDITIDGRPSLTDEFVIEKGITNPYFIEEG